MLERSSASKPTLTPAKKDIVRQTLAAMKNFRFCGPSDDPDEQTSVILVRHHSDPAQTPTGTQSSSADCRASKRVEW